ncbi:MAG: glycoside hydrolase family 3 C-terminal domain-containing protein [Bacteroidota bacterium]|nr:glycoside hydrolase family 3 C-terminal domain-containing protein [Bacteroidota bacterium]
MKRARHILLATTSFLFSLLLCNAQRGSKYPFQDYTLSFEQRVNDLVSRLTLEEKVAQMLNTAPAIERLGIPAYEWWNEILHGVARTPYRVTVYPQAIAMAATFDTASLHKMADYSAMEGRAIYYDNVQKNKYGTRYQGLTYWTPNINIFRDPRWGRGQETYGEDPFLTGTMGKAFVRGLQGDDPKYLKAAACAKHYAVHSGPEPLRHVFDAEVSDYDLWDTYLPAFRELVTNAKVAGVMCAYNAFKKQPCCGSDELMIDILRNRWKFSGYVTSDCGAIDDFFKNHKTHPDAESASADAVFHGTDVECGTDAYKALVKAVKDGKIPEKQIDVSVKRLFMIRFRLGMFDPPSMVKYAQTPASVLESPEHKAHSLKMAQQSIVLLRNENNTLPLSRKIKKIAVLGPNADNSVSVLGNYNGIPSEIITALQGIKNKLGAGTEVVFERAVNFTNDTLLAYSDISNQYSYEGKPGFKAEYFSNKELKGEPEITRQEDKLDHAWQEGEGVAGNIRAIDFSARYTTNFTANKNGDITFETDGDDGYKLIINGKEQINTWTRNRFGARTYKLNTKKDSVYKIVVEYWQGQGKANIKLRAGNYEKTDFTALANRVKDADAIVFVGGISPQLEGEEMRVDYPGFNGGDRTSILLPKIQTELMKAINTTGKPVVFVMMTGSAVAIPWEAENIPAIVNAWYGGQSAGTAIADVLFGDYNPAGRLPVTFYKSDSDLPEFNSYSMENRTYRYFKGDPLYGFGYGLSYTSFFYDQLKLPLSSATGKKILVSARVTNTGKRDGEEVVQLYASNENKTIKSPLRALRGFKRISLKAGESKVVQFELSPADLSVVDDKGTLKQVKGKVLISIGGGQPGEKNKTSGNVVKAEVKIE